MKLLKLSWFLFHMTVQIWKLYVIMFKYFYYIIEDMGRFIFSYIMISFFLCVIYTVIYHLLEILRIVSLGRFAFEQTL